MTEDLNETTILEPIMNNYLKSRKTRFANKNNVPVSSVEVINDVPISVMFAEWKKENSIRTKIFKNLSEEQQQNWYIYFDEHKNLSLTTSSSQIKSTNNKVNVSNKHDKEEKEHKEQLTKSNNKHNNKVNSIERVEEIDTKDEHTEKIEHKKHKSVNKSTTATAAKTKPKKETETIQQPKSEIKRHKSNNNKTSTK